MATAPAYHESLPYIDAEPTPEELAAASALIAAEQSSPVPEISHPEPAFSEAINTELSRIAASKTSNPLPKSHYESQSLPPSGEQTLDNVLEPLHNASISSTYLANRTQNLALLDKAGKNAWLLSNYHIEADLRAIETELAVTKREIDILNHARATRQNEVKGELQGLEETWKQGIGKVLETEIAVEELRQRIRDELKKNSDAQ